MLDLLTWLRRGGAAVRHGHASIYGGGRLPPSPSLSRETSPSDGGSFATDDASPGSLEAGRHAARDAAPHGSPPMYPPCDPAVYRV